MSTCNVTHCPQCIQTPYLKIIAVNASWLTVRLRSGLANYATPSIFLENIIILIFYDVYNTVNGLQDKSNQKIEDKYIHLF